MPLARHNHEPVRKTRSSDRRPLTLGLWVFNFERVSREETNVHHLRGKRKKRDTLIREIAAETGFSYRQLGYVKSMRF